MAKLPYIREVDMAEQSDLSYALGGGFEDSSGIGKHIRPELLLSPVGFEPE